MYSVPGDTTSLVPGFPIRTSSDPRSVGSSPRHIAASHVLHRLPVPRHPPCALKHLQTQKPIDKRNCTSTHQHTTTHPERPAATHSRARCSQPLSTNQTPHPTTKDGATTKPSHPQAEKNGPVVSKPNSVSGDSSPGRPKPTLTRGKRLSCTRTTPTTGAAHPTNRSQHRTPTRCGRVRVSWCSLERR